ncbi:MAG: hypothetical protein M0Z53_01850 [Thermaerobacter sp.]|nr:hypothetical protein [Thermaerobacter sp.]
MMMMMLILLVAVFLILVWLTIRPDTPAGRLMTSLAAGLVLAGGVLTVRAQASHPPTGWTWPANPAVMPVLTATGQELVLNAQVYPVAVVPVTNRRALTAFNAAYVAPSRTPHRLGFLAVIVPHPASTAAALRTARQQLAAAHVRVPWGVLIDPPAAYRQPAPQVYRPGPRGIRRVTGSAALAAWRQAVAPLPAPAAKGGASHA